MYKNSAIDTQFAGGGLLYNHSASVLDSPAIEIIEGKLFEKSGTLLGEAVCDGNN